MMTIPYRSQDAVMRHRIHKALREILDGELDPWPDDTLLRDIPDIHYDSVTVIGCVAAIEREFGVTIDFIDDDVGQTFQSVATLQGLVTKKLADQLALEGFHSEGGSWGETQ